MSHPPVLGELAETLRQLAAAKERRDVPEILRLRALVRQQADAARPHAHTEQAVSILNRSFR